MEPRKTPGTIGWRGSVSHWNQVGPSAPRARAAASSARHPATAANGIQLQRGTGRRPRVGEANSLRRRQPEISPPIGARAYGVEEPDGEGSADDRDFSLPELLGVAEEVPPSDFDAVGLAWLGEALARADSDGVAVRVGVGVGLRVGVGFGVALVGVGLGLTEGDADGLAEGETDGLAEGDADGLPEGDADGLAVFDGVGVGDFVGVRVGLTVGVGLGEALGLGETLGRGELVGPRSGIGPPGRGDGLPVR